MIARRAFLIAAVVALVVRLAYVLGARHLHLHTAFQAADSALYDVLARSVLAGEGLRAWGRPSAYVTPGYPLFVAGVYAVCGPSLLAVGVAQAALGALTAGLIALIAARLYGARAGLCAGLCAALYPHLVFWTGHLLTETLFVSCTIAALWLLCEGQERGAIPWFAAAGVALGAGALVRPVLLPFIPVAAVAAAALAPRPAGDGARPRPTRAARALAAAALAPRPAARALAVACGALLLLLPWALRNAREVGTMTPASTESAFVFWQGNSPGATGGTRGYVDSHDFQRLPLPPGLGEAAQERAYRRAALAYLAAQPHMLLVRAPAKLWNMWRPVYAGASARGWLISGCCYLALLCLGLPPLLRRRRAHPGLGYVQLLFLTLLLLHTVVTGMIRFRLPLEAALCITAGAGLCRLHVRLRPPAGEVRS